MPEPDRLSTALTKHAGHTGMAGSASRATGTPALLLALLAGPSFVLGLYAAGVSLHAALLLGITGGWWALWTIRSLPLHFPPLLALLVLAMFSIKPIPVLMSGFGADALWWMLGS